MDPHPLDPVTEGALLDILGPRIPHNSLFNSRVEPHRLFSLDLFPSIPFQFCQISLSFAQVSHYRLRSDIILRGPPIHPFFTCLCII